MVSGLGSTRGESNHTERSHYFLKHLFKSVFYHINSTAEYNITSNQQTQQIQTDTNTSVVKQNRIIIIRNDIHHHHNIKITFMHKIIT